MSWLKSLTVASTVAALAVKPPAVVSFDIQRSTPANGSNPLRRRTVHAEKLDQVQELFYYIDFQLGTPPQHLSAILDTGSGGFTIMSSSSGTMLPTEDLPKFNESLSSTIEISHQSFSVKYIDDAFMNGFWSKDVFTYGNIRIPYLEFGLIKSSNRDFMICGIGLPMKYRTSTSFSYQLRENGIINHVVYSIWLNSESQGGGMILFGGIDRSLIKTNLYVFPVVESVFGNRNSPTIKLNEIHLFNSDGDMFLLAETSIPVVLDTGAPVSRMPFMILENLYAAMAAVKDETRGFWYVPCDQLDKKSGLVLLFSGVPFDFTFDEISIVIDDVRNRCIPGFLPSEVPLLGVNFLRVLYMVLDLEKLEVGLARANHKNCDTTPEIVEFSKSIIGIKAPEYSYVDLDFQVNAYPVTYDKNPLNGVNPRSRRVKGGSGCVDKYVSTIKAAELRRRPIHTRLEHIPVYEEDVPSVIPLNGEIDISSRIRKDM